MPSLLKIVFNATTTDARKPTSSDESSFILWTPNSPDVAVEATTSTLDLHTTITIPNGWYAYYTPKNGDITGATNCYTLPQIIMGTGSPVAITLEMVNPADEFSGANNQTPTAAVTLGTLTFHKTQLNTATFTGTWA